MKKKKSRTGAIIVAEYGSFNSALKEFTDGMSYEFLDWRRRQYFIHKPTHSARKRKGNKQESFRTKLRNILIQKGE